MKVLVACEESQRAELLRQLFCMGRLPGVREDVPDGEIGG